MIVLLAIPLAAQPAAAKTTDVVREFFAWYLHELERNKDPLTQDRKSVRKYVALSFLAEIERRRKSPDGLEADPFLQAQDFPEDWKDHISVTPGAGDTVNVALGAKESLNKLKVELRKEAGVWKLTRVERILH